MTDIERGDRVKADLNNLKSRHQLWLMVSDFFPTHVRHEYSVLDVKYWCGGFESMTVKCSCGERLLITREMGYEA